MTRQFVDTNVLLYAYDTSAGRKHERAADFVAALGRTRSGVISVQVLQEFYVNVTRKVVVPLAPADARERLRVLARWPLYSPLPDDVVSASEIAESAQLSFWDAMMVHSAAQMGCDLLWSEDLSSGQRIRTVTVADPFAD